MTQAQRHIIMADPETGTLRLANAEAEKVPAVAGPVWFKVLAMYGPMAFGVVVFMVLWLYVVAPELHAARETRDRNAETAQALAITAQALERTVIRLESIENNRAQHPR